jgi:hypothetical protein
MSTNYSTSRTYRSKLTNLKNQIPAGTEEIILAIVGSISCLNGFILNSDVTKISVLSQDIGSSTYSWLSNISVFIGSPLLFFAAYLISSGNMLAKKYIIGVLIVYSILIGICGYLITQDQGTIFNLDSSSSSSFFNFYGWFAVALGVIMMLYAGFIAYS